MNEKFLHNINLIEYFRRHKILLHFLYWSLWVCFFGYTWGTVDGYYLKTFSIELLELPVKLGVVYIYLYNFIPSFLFRKRYLEFACYSLLVLLLAGLLQRAVVFYGIEPLFWPERFSTGYFYLAGILASIVGITTPMILPISGKLLKYWYRVQQEKQELEHEKLQAELKLLRSQIHPHFLFNTLNSLYALSLKNSPKTPDVVMKLSELMHFMLYEANQSRVNLLKEVEFILNYVDLETVRFDNRFVFQKSIEGNLGSISVAPLILLPFVENCFKHGVSQETEGAWINFVLKLRDNELFFELENSISLHAKDKMEGIPQGIGLQNVKRRLEINYPGAYQLDIVPKQASYFVQLKLSLQ